MTTTEESLQTTFSNAGYWTAQRVGAVAQPTIIKLAEQITPADWKNPTGSSIYIKYLGSQPGMQRLHQGFEERREIVIRCSGTTLEVLRNIYQTVIKLITKYHAGLEVGYISRPTLRADALVVEIHVFQSELLYIS